MKKLDNIELTADIVVAYVGNNALPASDLGGLILSVSNAIYGLDTTSSKIQTLIPAVPVKKSVTRDYIICLEDGRKLKSMKRHLRNRYGMSPDDYRVRWSLPSDYPMTAPSYSKQRSELAKKMGLGRKKKK